MTKLWIRSIFNSIDGEVNASGQGCFSTFIRLAQCNLRCSYCDTKYAQGLDKATEMSVADIEDEVKKIGCNKITITGGEPLFQQPGVNLLIETLRKNKFSISVETNGSFPIPDDIRWRVRSWVVDYKTPSSGMMEYMDIGAFSGLTHGDFIKFVIGDYHDYKVAKWVVGNELPKYNSFAKPAFSPLMGEGGLEPQMLLKWMQEDKLFDVVFNTQIHKLLKLKEENYE